MEYLIEEAQARDIPALLQLESTFPSDKISRRQFLYHLQNPNALLLVCRRAEGTPVGYALFLTRGKSFSRFYSLVVSPNEQGRGLGKKLCQAGLAKLAKRGIKTVSLEVDAADQRAISLYKSLGFSPVALLEDYYEDHRSALKMKKGME